MLHPMREAMINPWGRCRRGVGWFLVALLPVFWQACGGQQSGPPAARLVVANTYLESAVLDLLGDHTRLIRLAEACPCPGHYRLESGTVAAVRGAALFFRFESETDLANQVRVGPVDPVRVVALPVPAGTLTAEEYVALCRGVGAALVAARWLTAAEAEVRLHKLSGQLEAVTGKVRQQLAEAQLRGVPVLAAAGQERFCEWLGFKVAGTLRPADGATPATIEALVVKARAAGVRVVVTDSTAIKPLADTVAERLGWNATRLASMPPLLTQRPAYEEMLRLNASAFLPARHSGANP
jgi:ABC-type Zn uptake system ZnuABC Zn-binding protein ZnuA